MDYQKQQVQDMQAKYTKHAVFALVFFIMYEVVSIITFRQVNDKYTEDSAEVILWKKNYKDGGCGELEMTYSLQNACLNGCDLTAVRIYASQLDATEMLPGFNRLVHHGLHAPAGEE